jgi:hypothetical protein
MLLIINDRRSADSSPDIHRGQNDSMELWIPAPDRSGQAPIVIRGGFRGNGFESHFDPFSKE